MALQVAALSFEAIEALRPLAARIRRQDRSLADQLVRAASSVALNIAEGMRRRQGISGRGSFNAAGSASESLAALKVAVAWGYLGAEDAGSAALLLGRVLAMLKKLARR
jgi:four helix bundle protein